jgi:hypothetical protein
MIPEAANRGLGHSGNLASAHGRKTSRCAGDQLCLFRADEGRSRAHPRGRERDRTLRLIRRAAGYETEVAQGRDFWQVIVERYGLSLDVVGGTLEASRRRGRWWWWRTTPTASSTG